MIDERLLHRVQLISDGNSLDRSYCRSTDLGNRNKATVHDLSVDNNRARAALAFTAALLGPGKPQLFAQHVEQASHRKHLKPSLLAIDRKVDCVSGGHLNYKRRCQSIFPQRRKDAKKKVLSWRLCAFAGDSYSERIVSINVSGISGTRLKLTPVAFSIAFKIAGAAPSIGNSPIPFAPPGP
jgi:hypothetical protein